VSGRKFTFLDSVLRTARRWPGEPAVFVGDTNSGRREIDEQVPAFNAREHGWMDRIEAAGWRDAFRHVRGAARAYTWYSPNGGNGFRIDQAFVNAALLAGLSRARHVWAAPAPARCRQLGSRRAHPDFSNVEGRAAPPPALPHPTRLRRVGDQHPCPVRASHPRFSDQGRQSTMAAPVAPRRRDP
jgi:hypothetical protein